MIEETKIKNKLEELKNLYKKSCVYTPDAPIIMGVPAEWKRRELIKEKYEYEFVLRSEMAILEWILEAKA